MIDLYARNPTSTDRNIDVDEAWFRFGRETDPAALPEHSGAYLKVGKMPKFERQDDRQPGELRVGLDRFNRFEDFGLEAGVDLGRHAYVKASLTSGNPVSSATPTPWPATTAPPSCSARSRTPS